MFTHRFTNPVCLAAFAGLAMPQGAVAQQAASATWTHDLRSAEIGKPLSWSPLDLAAKPVPVVRLGPINVHQMVKEDRDAAARGERVLRYGVGRDCEVLPHQGAWFEVGSGSSKAWVVDIEALGAIGLRVRLSGLELPPGASIAVYSVGIESPSVRSRHDGPYLGRGPFENGEVWTPTSPGERVRIEYRCPSAWASPQLPFQLTRVQHVYRDPSKGFPDQPCYDDAGCSPQWQAVAKACVGIGFVGQNAMFCSGQMLSTTAGDHTPYLLTASQCIGTPALAQTAEVYFDVQTVECDGPGPPFALVPRASGCSLLTVNPWADSSLLMIEGPLPPNRSWAGWTATPVPVGQQVGCVHFPENQPARLSLGSQAAGVVCGGTGHLRAIWTSGPTGPGSAGAGLFTDDSSRALVGVLSCGSSSCGSPGGNDFGSFSAFYPFVAPLLAAGSDDGFEPNDSCRAAAPVPPGTWHGLVVKSVSEDWYRAVVAPGDTFAATLAFVHLHGDVDTELYTECEQVPVQVSLGTSNAESVVWTNTSGAAVEVFLRVFLDSDTRNTYAMTVSNGVPPGLGACCLPSATCSLTGSVECAAAGGVYAGHGRPCEGACYMVSYVGPAVPIADGTTVCGPAAAAAVTISEDVRIAGVGAGFRIVHPYQGDVRATLRHVPSGITVPLVDRPGVPQTLFGFPNDNYGASPSNLFVSLDAAATVYDLPVLGIDSVSGPWKAEGTLSAFVGASAQGVWQLRVEDCAAGETGSIVAFRLIIAAAPNCYANCDGSAVPPVLTANDFQCFLNLYAIGSSQANCDGSVAEPLLTANDFQCFLNKYALGCS